MSPPLRFAKTCTGGALAVLAFAACMPQNNSTLAHSADPCSGQLLDLESVDERCLVPANEAPTVSPDALEFSVRERTLQSGQKDPLTFEMKNTTGKMLTVAVDRSAFQATLSGGNLRSYDLECGKPPKPAVGEQRVPRLAIGPGGVIRATLSVDVTWKMSHTCTPRQVDNLPPGDYQLEIRLPFQDAKGNPRSYKQRILVER